MEGPMSFIQVTYIVVCLFCLLTIFVECQVLVTCLESSLTNNYTPTTRPRPLLHHPTARPRPLLCVYFVCSLPLQSVRYQSRVVVSSLLNNYTLTTRPRPLLDHTHLYTTPTSIPRPLLHHAHFYITPTSIPLLAYMYTC